MNSKIISIIAVMIGLATIGVSFVNPSFNSDSGRISLACPDCPNVTIPSCPNCSLSCSNVTCTTPNVNYTLSCPQCPSFNTTNFTCPNLTCPTIIINITNSTG